MLLFQTDPAETGLGQDPTSDGFGFSKFRDEFKNALNSAFNFNRYQTFFIKLEDQAVKTSRSLAGSIDGYSGMLQKTMFSVYEDTIKIGGSTKDTIDFAEGFADQTGRIPSLQKDIIVSAVKISKEFGISTKEVAQMAGEFAKVGLGQSMAIKAIRTIGDTARRYGVNAQALTKTVQENLKKSAGYTFKDGIEGLTKMAAQAQRLGISIDNAFSLYQEFLDPDKAIEYASEISMLGGKFAQTFGDPFKNMSMSVEEIQQGLVDAAQESAVFNEKTQEFEIPRAQQQAMMAFTSKMGMDYSDFVSTVKQGAKEMKVMNEVGFKPDVSEDDRKLLSSMAEQKDGKWQVQLPGTEDWVEVSTITANSMKAFQDRATTEEKSAGEINSSLLSIAERQNVTLQQIRDAIVLREGLNAGMAAANIADKVSEAAGRAVDTIQGAFPPELMGQVLTKLSESFSEYVDVDLQNDMNLVVENLIKIATGVIEMTKPTPTIPTAPDAFTSPVEGGNLITGPKGSFLTIPEDEVLAAPNISTFIDSAMSAFNQLNDLNIKTANQSSLGEKTSATLQSTLGEKSNKLSEVITTNTNTNINTTNTQKMEGGFTVTIDASKVPNSLDPTMLKDEMMKVLYQIGDEMKKQGVLNFKL